MNTEYPDWDVIRATLLSVINDPEAKPTQVQWLLAVIALQMMEWE